MIRLRKKHKVFGRGTFEIVESDNRKILTYIRHYQNEKLLVVANLSRYPQSARLELKEFAGIQPTEMLGLGQFHSITEEPYILTLGPYSFYWLALELPQESVPITMQPKPPEVISQEEQQQIRETVQLVRANRREDWQTLMTGTDADIFHPLLGIAEGLRTGGGNLRPDPAFPPPAYGIGAP